jgi:putative lipoprotein
MTPSRVLTLSSAGAPSSPRRAAPRALLAAPCAVLVALLAVTVPSVAHADPPRPDPDPWCAPDKALHFAASSFIAGGGYGVTAFATDDMAARAAVAASIAITAGLAKEAFDAAGFGSASPRDLVWDLVGTAFGLSIALTIDLAAR